MLNNAPGVFSSSYAGENATRKENIQKVLNDVSIHPAKVIKARCVTVLCLMKHAHNPTPWLITETLEGEIAKQSCKQTREYDSIFFLHTFGKTLGELSIAEKNHVSARSRAVLKLKQHLDTYF